MATSSGVELARQIAKLGPAQQMRDELRRLVTSNRAAVDGRFVGEMLDLVAQFRKKNQSSEAVDLLRKLFDAGNVLADPSLKATARLEMATLQLEMRGESDADKVKDHLEKCLSECQSISDGTKRLPIEAEARMILGVLYLEQMDQPKLAAPEFEKAAELFTRLHLPNRAATASQYGETARESKGTQGQLFERIDLITRSQSALSDLSSKIRAAQDEYNAIRAKIDESQAQLKENVANAEEIQVETKALRTEAQALKDQLAALRVAQSAPLWTASLRAAIESKIIPADALQVLNKLRLKDHLQVEAFLAEIHARNGTAPEAALNTTDLTGEQRLFAQIANLRMRPQQDDLEGIELLLEAWEEYVISYAQVAQ